MIDLLPDDPVEIRRIYLDIQAEKSKEETLGFVPIVPPLLTLVELFIDGYVIWRLLAPRVGLWTLILVPAGLILTWFVALVLQSIIADPSRTKERLASRSSDLGNGVTGPISLVYFVVALTLSRPRSKRVKEADIDVDSLEVLEPVARAIAEPILARARKESTEPEDEKSDSYRRVAKLRLRIKELHREAAEENDLAWRQATLDRAEGLEAEIRREEEALSEHGTVRGRIASEADAVEDLLVKLARRRKLLGEIMEDRQDDQGEDEGSDKRRVDDLRERLRGLGESVAARDAGTAQLKAEIEMRELEER